MTTSTPKWKIEAERAEKAEKALQDLKDQIPKVLSECIAEYGLDLCDDGLDDFCSRLGAKWEPTVPANITISIDNIILPGTQNGFHEVHIQDENLSDDLENLISDFLGKRFPNATWDSHDVTFGRVY